MKITLTDAGKRFNSDWIFRHLSYEFSTGHSYAITGPNGSGKSTLLQVIAGAIALSEGKIRYGTASAEYAGDQAYRYISLTAPYMELVEEMTLREFLRFHEVFKPFLPSISIDRIIHLVQLEGSAHKQIRLFSSGMKQRAKLAQALFSSTPVVLLDEPCTNLDAEGIALYNELIGEFAKDRMVIVSSNDHQEYSFCEMNIEMADWKK